jgi:Putative adhesin
MKKQSIVIVLTMFFACLAAVAMAQNQNEFTVALSDPAKRGKIKVHLNSGSITIKGTARKDVLVRYKAEGDDEEGKNKTKNGLKRVSGGGIDLEASENDNYVTIKSNSWNNQVDLEIEIPSGFDVQAHTYNNGDLMTSSIQGELALTNYNGEITALNISGSVIATTYNGEIKITFDKITEGVPMSYHTYNGDVDVSFPASTKASFKMKTEQGDIYTDFDMKISATGPKKTEDNKSGTFKIVIDDWKKGDINGGGAEITMKTNNGDVYIRKKG